MDELPHRALLPAGFNDVLPPDAAFEAAVVERMMARLAAHDYARVRPPLVEFEATLLGGIGAAMAGQTFRLMDPVSQRMMGLRADMTVQVARIAGSRLARAPRPLRLGYAGDVLQVRGSQLRPERQFGQVGVELIGSAEPAADAEVARMAVLALAEVGIGGLSLDVGLPPLVPALVRALALPDGQAGSLRRALDRKDAARVLALGGAAAPLLHALLTAGGPAERALAAVADLRLPDDGAAAQLDRLAATVRLIRDAMPDLPLTVDFVEFRGFEYHTGVSFTLFARGVRGELGRGGRYLAEPAGAASGAVTAFAADAAEPEPATGFTLFMDSVMRAVPPPPPPRRIFVPFGTSDAGLRAAAGPGLVTVAGLAPVADDADEARRLGCDRVFRNGSVEELS